MNKAFQYPFNGQWLPNVEPLHVGHSNYTQLQNMRYTDTGVETCEGYSKITTNPLGYASYSGFHFGKGSESHFITKISNKLYDNETTIPNQGDYTATALTTTTLSPSRTIGSGIGSYSYGPNGIMLYGDSSGAYLYGGDFVDPAVVFISTDSSVPLSDSFDYTEEATRSTGTFTITSSGYLYIGLPYHAYEFYITVSSANVSASSMTYEHWNGSAWNSFSVSDGTASGGISLAQSGTVLGTPTNNPSPLYINGDVLYWYRLKISAGSAVISRIQASVPFQEFHDLWNGSGRTCIGFHVYREGKYEDLTYQVVERSTADAPYGANIGGLAATDSIYLVFEEQMMGLDIRMLDKYINDISTEISSIAYWDGDSFASLTNIIDRTQKSSGDTTLNKSGVITWYPPSDEHPKEDFGVFGYVYRIIFNGFLTDKQLAADFYNATCTFANATQTITENDPGTLWPDIDTPFSAGDIFHISGTDLNDGTFTVASTAANVITVESGISDEAAGDVVHFKKYVNEDIYGGTTIDTVSGITAPINMSGYDAVGFYGGRAMLIEGNRVDYSLPDAPWVFNGVNTSNRGGVAKASLYFGDDSQITATHVLSNRYGSNILQTWLVTKKNETYALAGSQPYADFGEPFTIRRMSSVYGCPAPMTMREVQVAFEGIQRNAIMWLDSSGPVIYDGATIVQVKGIENYFDPSESEYIKTSIIEKSTAYFDKVHHEYNLIFPSGSAATANNKWLVYDFKKSRWYEKYPGATASYYPIYTVGVKDSYGKTYNYGHLDSGHLMRMDNTQTWDGTAITQYIKTGEILPALIDEMGFWSSSEIKQLKLVSKKISEAATVTVSFYVDGSISGTVSQTIALNSGSGISSNKMAANKAGLQGYIFQILFGTQTSTYKWVPLLWGYKADLIRED